MNTISLPSGDHEALDTERVKYKSSMGIGRAAGLESEVSDFGSVIGRVSGPEDCAREKAETAKSDRTNERKRRVYIVTSREEIGPR